MIDFYRLPDTWTVCKYRFPLTRLDKDQRILTIESEKRLDHSVLCAATQRDVNNPGPEVDRATGSRRHQNAGTSGQPA